MLGRLCAGVLETIDLLGDCVAHSLAHVEGVELRAVLIDDVVIALAELLADRGELLPEQVLTVLLVDALGDVGADRFGDTQLGEVFLCPRLDQLDASRRIDGVQHGKTLVGVEVGPGCDPVGELARGLGGLQQLRKTARVAQPGDLGEHGPQLTNSRLETGDGRGSRRNWTSAYDGRARWRARRRSWHDRRCGRWRPVRPLASCRCRERAP